MRIKKGPKGGKKLPLSLVIPIVLGICMILDLFLIGEVTGTSKDETKPVVQDVSPTKTTTTANILNSKAPIVAHVVSLIKCSKQASVTGFLDAAAVLRHSIHKQSVHEGTSKYSYKMYAIVHENCKHHAHVLDRLGYTSLVKPSPVQLDEITPGWYRDHVEGENCCGSSEFIKLHAYTLMDHPVTVHWDLDVAVFQPMDDLFDSIIYPHDSPEGVAARARLEVQHPERTLPRHIDAFITRDITSSQPWEMHQGVQGGFLVAKPSMENFEKYLEFIREGNYVRGRGNDRGWYGLGYGGFQGAMAYQGVVAYFYDQIAVNTAVELDVCVWNQVVADVIWRGPQKMDHANQCREHPRDGETFEQNTPENKRCQDCRIFPVDKTKSAHYTACKKPWECLIAHPRHAADKSQQTRLNNLTNITTCGLLMRKWFDLRSDFEEKLHKTAGVVPATRDGSFKPESFGGYCKGRGAYIAMNVPPENFDISKMYGL
ncbi:unnamed protein product [Cylindrotheca closterium]|uniref:Nucleotide-diphospho-sugar transferase domain-containing protein n=1 Tax=Cylindrotheca closterium TaxID=2856 RepID=A0AAD2FX29_9STRA|nr:unnamed protein product [Cylindrotheca closterium]